MSYWHHVTYSQTLYFSSPLCPPTSPRLSPSHRSFDLRGGTTYTVTGNELDVPQIRHLVFYAVSNNQLPPPPPPSPPPSSPSSSPQPSSNMATQDSRQEKKEKQAVQVPRPEVTTDPVTMCVKTWDVMSEVGSRIDQSKGSL